jgi:hypothetical protein
MYFVTNHKSSQLFSGVQLQYEPGHPVKQRNRMEFTGSWRDIFPACQSFLQKRSFILLCVDVQVSFAVEYYSESWKNRELLKLQIIYYLCLISGYFLFFDRLKVMI